MSLVTSNTRVEYSEIVEPAKALSSLPSHFETQADELVKLLEAYYRYLNKKHGSIGGPSYEINNIRVNHDIDMATDDRYLDAIERLVGSYIPPSRAIDRVRLYKIIANYYTNRGSEESIYSFFRLFFNEIVSIFYPKEYLFTSSPGLEDKGLTSNKFRLTDNLRWQNYSYVIYTQLQKSEWGAEYAKYIHPAGLKFFATLFFEIANNNDWQNVGCLDIDWSEYPNQFLDDVYTSPSGSGVYYFEDVGDLYYYNESVFSSGKIDTIVDDNCWRSINWDEAIGKHTPTQQSPAYIRDFINILSLLPDGGYHYIRNLRPIRGQNGNVFDEALRAFYITYGISSKNQNTSLNIFRDLWNGYDKTIDSATLGEYGDMILNDAISPSQGSGPQFNNLNSYIVYDGNYNSAYDGQLGEEQTYTTDDEASAIAEEGAIAF